MITYICFASYTGLVFIVQHIIDLFDAEASMKKVGMIREQIPIKWNKFLDLKRNINLAFLQI